MNDKYERYVNYIVDDLIKSSAKYIFDVPTGAWETNPETNEMEFVTYNSEYSGIGFEPLEMLALNKKEILDDELDFNYELNHYIEKLYGVKSFSRESDKIIKLYVDKVFDLFDSLPVIRKKG